MTKNNFSILQITIPLLVLGLATLSSLTSVYLVDGCYEFRFDATKDGVSIGTNVDKRASVQEQCGLEETALPNSRDH
ncbi:MAG: hypothetical protein F6K31_16965 [Symploca sp. SIO2G7]|nr:hypothetical protein [Symploca sp. SIO2G7]